MPLTLGAYELWADLEQRRGEQLFHEIGLLQIGPAEGEVLRGVQESAQRHGLDVEEFSAEEIALRWPGFRMPVHGGTSGFSGQWGWRGLRDRTALRGRQLVRGASRADGKLKAQIPWLRVFVEGVVIVGKLGN